MDHLSIQTAGGRLSFVGRIHTDRPRPSLLAVRGTFPPKNHMLDLPTHFAGANVLVVTLPGMGGGAFWADQPSLEGLTRGLEDATRMLLPQAPIVAFGASAGNLVSLGLRLPNIHHRVALEPFFQTEHLWPLVANSRKRMALNPGLEPMARFFWEVFGIGADRCVNRDYRRLLENITVATDVVVGQVPLLPERALDTWPSFTSAEDRAALAANPLVTLHEGPAGAGHSHGSGGASYETLKALLLAALQDAARFCG